MATEPTMDYVRELMDKHGVLLESAPTKFVTVLPTSGWRKLTPLEKRGLATLETAIRPSVIGVDLAKDHDRTVLMRSRSLGKTSLFNNVVQAAADRIATLEVENATLRAHPWVVANAAASDTGPKADYHGPDDTAHRAVHDVTEHLLNGRVTNQKARAGLRDALDKADKPSTGRKASDQAIGRALRFIAPQIGLRTL